MKSVEESGLLKGIWRVGKDYWRSEEKKYALLLLLIIIGLSILGVSIQVWLNQWRNVFFNTLQNRDMPAFLDAVGLWVLLIAAAWGVAVYQHYLNRLLSIKWRKWLTERLLGDYLQSRKYYCLQLRNNGVDNPDQMICEDVRQFIELLLRIFLWFLYTVGIIGSFTLILWNLSGEFTFTGNGWQASIPGDMLWIAVGYALLVNGLIGRAGQPLVQLNFLQQRYEADFRFALVRLREYAREVALYAGEQPEGNILRGYFQKIYDNFRCCITRQKLLDGLIFALYRGAEPLPYLVAMPRFFSGQLQLGGLMQITGAFDKVQKALMFFPSWYKELAELQAVVNRLAMLMDELDELQLRSENPSIQFIAAAEPDFSVEALHLRLPDGNLVVRNFEMRLQAGESLLITGASGCGKSMLIKAIAGMWPFGEGRIRFPQEQKCLFLPQKPYLPLGSLRDILAYPCSKTEYSEQAFRSVLRKCQLDRLLDKLDVQENWSHILSLGEQQRIGFARAILQQPRWLFLDEATSGLDDAAEKRLYQLVRLELRGAGIVSVGHRSNLQAYHDKVLLIQEAGCWVLVA